MRRSVYTGEIHKCPNCGSPLEAFALNCPACGYELRGGDNTSSIKPFVMQLEKIDQRREAKRAGSSFLQGFTQYLFTSAIDAQKVSLIKNFAIPTTKEDILEFFILASSNIDLKVYGLLRGNCTKAQRELSEA